MGAPHPPAVILSAAKDLRSAQPEILRCAQDDSRASVHAYGGEPSLIAGITRQLMSQYQVDSSRVYVAGMSAGGAMAVIVAAMYQGSVSHAQHLREIIPLIAFHGDSDTTVAPVNADGLLDQWLQAASAGLGVKAEQGQVGMPTPAASTTTSAVRPSSSSGQFIRQIMPGQEGVPVGPLPIHRDRTPRRRWCAFSRSIPFVVFVVKQGICYNMYNLGCCNSCPVREQLFLR